MTYEEPDPTRRDDYTTGRHEERARCLRLLEYFHQRELKGEKIGLDEIMCWLKSGISVGPGGIHDKLTL